MTVLVSNLAPIRDPEVAFFQALMRGFERQGHRAILWSAAFHPALARWLVPMHWTIANWPHYYASLPSEGVEVDRDTWLPRVARLVKQEGTPEEMLDTIARVTRLVCDTWRPDLVLSWNTLCPHTGVLAEACRAEGVPVYLLERGMFPKTWYLEAGGLVGHSAIAGVPLESLVPPDRWAESTAIGQEYLARVSFDAFNSYPQTVTDMDAVERACARHAHTIAFFPPDDGSLGFVPADHDDRRRTLPCFGTSFEAARALARHTDAAVLFKPHPSFIGERFDTSGLDNLFVVSTDFRVLMDRATAVASTGSGLAFVALARGKPVITQATEWLHGKGIAYDAACERELSRAAADACAGIGLADRRERFATMVGWMMTEYLVSAPDAPEGYLRPDAAAARVAASVRRKTPATPAASVTERRRTTLAPVVADFLSAQAALGGIREPDSGARVVTELGRLTAAPDADGRTVVLDFDHTLLLGNSTELFLATSSPRWMAHLAATAADECHFLLRAGTASYVTWRDYVRVIAVALLVPWSLWLWRRRAPALARERLNVALWEPVAHHRVHVASLGFAQLIGPLLRQLPRSVPLTASSLWRPWSALRRVGKRTAVERAIGTEELGRSIVVTDSIEDLPLLEAAAHPLLGAWPEPPLPAPAYVPLRYTAEGKYPGLRILVNQHLGEDLAVALLAFAWWNSSIVSLLAWFFALWAVYEIGYYENDFVSAKTEAAPVVSKAHARFAGYAISAAWIWASALTAVGVAAWPGAPATAAITWTFVLVATRLVFAGYNRLPVESRAWAYPLLQAIKTGAPALLFAVSLPAGLLLVAQVFRQVTNYTLYRAGGNVKAFRRQTHRAVVFATLAILAAMATRSVAAFLTWQSALIAGWMAFRIARERFGTLRQMLGRLAKRVRRAPRPAAVAASDGRTPVVVFGAGIGGQRAAAALEQTCRVTAFCDNDARKHGTIVRGVPVVPPAALGAWPERVVHIAAYYHAHDIYTQLRNLGLPDDRIRFFPLAEP